MGATVIDSRIFGNIFSSDAMRQVWSDESRTARYVEIEKALATVQGRLGIIPQEAADEIARNCDLGRIDMEKLRAETERIGYPILGVVSQLNALCRDKLGEYCHWGATTQDITDTATVMQIRDGLAIVEQDLAALSAVLAGLARRHRDTPIVGRSNLQQAIPVTFGYKMATILAAVERHRERLQQLKPRVLVGEFGGACGTLASIGEGAMATQAGLMAELGLGQPVIAWHTVRDCIAEVGAFLGLVGGTLGKLSMDIKLMMQTEVAEVCEPYAPGRGSSSTMPQKRNPISSCYIHAAVSVVRQHAAALMDAMIADHERSTGPWEIEWIVLPEAFCLTAGALKQTLFVLKGLEVDAARMRANIGITHGLVMSEAVMMGLGCHIGREYAHDLVYDICREAIRTNTPLVDLLALHPEVNRHLDRAALAKLCDPANYLGQAGVMVDRVLATIDAH
jgi:3-carboxy-cis,cis-muconate cycloisomerase